MINKIGSNINFRGTVHLGGQTDEEKEKLARTINGFDTVSKNTLLSGMKKLKGKLEANTPDDKTYVINFQKGTIAQCGDKYPQLRSNCGGLSLMLLSIKPNDEAPHVYWRTSADTHSRFSFTEATKFSSFGRAKALKQIFNEANRWLPLYDGYKEKDPKEEKEIASIMDQLG